MAKLREYSDRRLGGYLRNVDSSSSSWRRLPWMSNGTVASLPRMIMRISGGMQMDLEQIKPVLLGAVGGGIVLAVIGFNWGGWVTGGTAQEMAEELAQKAVVARLAPICVEQYNQDSEKDQKLANLKETKSWERDDYVVNQGWATMPGEKEADSKVAKKCAELLVELG